MNGLQLGANVKVQGVCFLLCLAAGLCAGVFALLYLRKAGALERALADLFATLCIGGVFLVCVEFILDGKPELYGLCAYILGVCVLPLMVKKIKARRAKKH